jgi:hypothetical protein
MIEYGGFIRRVRDGRRYTLVLMPELLQRRRPEAGLGTFRTVS